ncbi:hypothetical protein [Larkinella arboricola]
MKNLDPFKGVTYKLNYRPTNTQIQGLVIDAKTGQSLTIPVQVTILGKDASRVVNFNGKAQTTYSSPKGDLFIGLKGDVPTRQAAAELRVVVDAAGYIPSGVDLKLTRDLNDPFIIRLVKETDPPQGVTVKQDQLTLGTNGTLPAGKEIVLAATSMTAPATIQFASGTVMKDEQGNTVSGTVAATVAVYSRLAKSIPVGLTTKVTQNGSTKDVTLHLANYISVNLANKDGKSVTSFTKPVEIKMGIAAGFPNLSTGQPVKAGDQLTVYARNEKTGSWESVQKVKVEAKGSDFVVSFPVSHFTDYAVGGSLATQPAFFTFVGLPSTFSVLYELNVLVPTVSQPDDNTIVAAAGTAGHNSIGAGAPVGVPFTLNLYDALGNLLSQTSGQNLSGEHIVTVPRPSGTIDVDFTIRATCENGKNIEVYPTTLVRYGKPGADLATFAGVTLINGKGKLVGLKPNTTYEARVDYEGAWSAVFTTGTASESRNLTYVLKSHTEACK